MENLLNLKIAGAMKTKILIISFFISVIDISYAQNPEIQGDLKELFAGPSTPLDHDLWIEGMKNWKSKERLNIGYNDAEYLQPKLGWLKSTFIYAQMMAHDRYFYDPELGKYTVDRYLNDLQKRYGGIDAVLIWPTYPNIGIDNRNQYDLLHDMPGGIDAIKEMILDFKKQGVRVFFPIMVWDHGTRKIKLSMPVALINEMKNIGADGLNGDTMWGVTEDYKTAADSLDYPVAFQPEIAIEDLKMVEWNTSSWGYFWNYTFVPGVSIYKWLEPRHQVYVTNRWVTDRTDDLQYAFFNGVGYNTWENIWGVYNRISDQNAEAVRRISKIYHQFPDIWGSSKWEPHVPTVQNGVFASKFPGLDKTIFTLVNRDTMAYDGKQLKLPFDGNMQYYDLWHGTLLEQVKENDSIYLSFRMEGRGFGAVLGIKSYTSENINDGFIDEMHDLARQPLNSFSTTWNPIVQQIVPIEESKGNKKVLKEMILIPAAKEYNFESNGVMIEGDPLPTAVGVQHPWEDHPARSQKHIMDVPSFYIDKYPVTNKKFKKFIDAAHYQPKDDHNFLKDWKNGNYPKGWGDKPVTWVSLEDARAYASWAGKRLPHEWEWQYAAQGNDGLNYPWGNEMDSTKMPPPDSTRVMRTLTDVNAYPQGASPFGVMDMVGDVWQWTDEYIDEHTRAAILKGGGYYRAITSDWYFPRAYELNKYGKYLLMAPSLDRSGAIGFRCVADK